MVVAAAAADVTAAFDVLSAFEPLARLERRSPTLDGAVPLRVAQACVPLLEGNEAGFQVVFAKRLVVRSRLGRLRIEAAPPVDSAHRAAVPLLAVRGYMHDAWRDRLARGWWWSERGVLRVWTGLLVRPRVGVWLRVSATKNRAPFGVRIRTAWIGDGEAAGAGYTPLVVDVEEIADGARLEGEVATVLPVEPGIAIEQADDEVARALVAAHAAFYDARYFATKKGEVTRKYRRQVARDRGAREEAPRDVAEIVHLAGPAPEVTRVDRVLGPDATSPAPASAGWVESVRFRHAVPLRVHWDGGTVDVAPDAAALDAGAREVRVELTRLHGEGFLRAHEGAVLYLTKYVTPHPHGEPHFFVKPWAFVRTPDGVSSLVEGISGPGHELLRGVVWTDRFHATPAVFHVTTTKPLVVRRGAPMLDVVPLRRAVLEETFATRSEA